MSLGNTVFNTLSKRELKTLLCTVPLVFAGYAHAVPDGGIVSQENLTLEVIEKPQDQEYPLTSAYLK
jgi:hypothetical protein